MSEKRDGHRGLLFKPSAVPIRSSSWISPQGICYPCEGDHLKLAGHLAANIRKHDDETPSKTLLRHGWIRVYGPGYYEVGRFEGETKDEVVLLVSKLSADYPVVLDIVADSGTKSESMPAARFLETFG